MNTLKTHIITDFDGVINAFPDEKVLRRGGIGHTGWMNDKDPRKNLYDIDNAFILDGNKQVKVLDRQTLEYKKYRIHWSHEVTDGIANTVSTGLADITWLSTWQENTMILDNLLGWNGITDTAKWFNPDIRPTSQEGKVSWLESYVRNAYRYTARTHPGMADEELASILNPIIWIDDEMVLNWSMNRIENATPAPILFIRPDWRTGLNRKQMNAMLAWMQSDCRHTDYLLEPLVD